MRITLFNLKWLTMIALLTPLSFSICLAEEETPNDQQIHNIQFSLKDSEDLKNARANEKFIKLLDMPATLSPDTLNGIDFAVRKLAFYHFGDRRNKRFSRSFYETIEQKIINKFSRLARFAVHECMECKTTKILLKEKQFSVLRHVDSNESLKRIATDIGVDHFVLWDAILHHDQAIINVRIVSSETGEIHWTQQYLSKIDYNSDWEFYTSMWGVKATRKSTSSNADIEVWPLIALGLRTLERSTVSNRLYYGYGAEIFTNTTDRDFIDVLGFNVNGRIAIELDTLVGLEIKNYGNWLAYASLGQTFLKNTPTVLWRTGFELRPNRRNFIDVGLVGLISRDFVVAKKEGYEDTANLGGISADLTIGIRF